MNLSQIAYRRRPVFYLATVVAMLYGVVSYFTLPAREDPKITIREAVVSTAFPGLPAEQVEENITKPLEESIRLIGEVEEIRSTSMRGRSILHVEIQDRYFDLDQIWDEVRKKVEAVRPSLPAGTQDPVIDDDFGDVAVVTAALTADDFPQAEQQEIAEHIRAALYATDGTKSVELIGVQPQRIFIDISEAKMAELELSPSDLATQIQKRNIFPPGGVLEAGEQRLALEISGEFPSVEALGDAEIRLPNGGGTLRLRDLGEISRGYADPVDKPAYFNGKRAIVFAISMLDGVSVLDYGQAIKARIDELQKTLPVGYRLEIMTFQPTQVANAVYGVTSSVLQTLGIVLAVVVLFLGVRTGLIVGSIIPAVMLVTLAIMGLLDMTLQRASLATLVIALGLLVDNAIVIAEDFKTRLEAGSQRDQALRETGSELAIPLLSSTLTTVLVFLPLMLAQHVSGEYTRSISIVIAITLLSSWFLSLTVTPALCHRFLKAPTRAGDGEAEPTNVSDRMFRGMSRRYAWLLRRLLRHRVLFLGVMALALVAGVAIMQAVPKKFFPDSDRNQVLVYVDFPSDIAASEADRKMQRLTRELQQVPDMSDDITSIAAYSGFGGPRFVLSLTPIDPAPNKGFMVLNVADRDRVDHVIGSTRAFFANQYPDVSPQVTKMFLGPSDSSLLEVQAKGPDRDVLYATAKEVEAILASLDGAIDIRQSWEARIPSLRIEVDQARARQAGITSEDIANSLQSAIDGYHLSHFREGDDIIPVMLRYAKEDRSSLQRLKSLTIYPLDSPGDGVTLNQVASIELDNGYYRIDRENLVRTITVEGRNRYLTAEDMVPRLESRLTELEASLPPGHWIEFDGVVIESAEGQAALQANLPICLGLIFILLVAQFNSFKRPLLIVATIPLIITGIAVGLLAMRADFGFMVLLGIYSLAGIIINNAIVLIDRIDIERSEPGAKALDAVVKASERRLRPILMSAATTILGFLPLIVGHDPLFYGMASAMAFGLGMGTLMSLGVVPVLYTYFFGIDTRPQAAE
ncbi:acriflavine resistance protein B [Litchfieldella anticariensis FP35 = DSM 16096]|uniref:Acriflavine resistance protein B n=1 Tax=Litchfieldella anticariensis (strain DSM 16096 / CECT 5854 / CIP 108499 / LMG 22089 / FP35) TaxID=1121939 RepID=S2LBB0_LITA3|nr:efflux RND transporter permease subunit [Halomonas anticariensis]EPC01996.1 acriflavine resistance protein B [Halomonas anticariensis FP35 = DSM 16096]